MNIFEQADLARSKFTETDEEIYSSLIKLPHFFSDNSITKTARLCGCSAAALTRFTKKIGFNGFKEFQYKLTKDLNENNGLKRLTEKDHYTFLLDSIERISKNSEFFCLSNHIKNAKYIYTYGFNLARLAAEFLSIGLNDGFGDIVLAQCLPYDLILKKYNVHDVLIIFSSYKGEAYQKLCKTIYNYPTSLRPYVCLITMNPKHKLSKYVDDMIVLPSVKQATANHQITLELTAFNMFIDFLLTSLYD